MKILHILTLIFISTSPLFSEIKRLEHDKHIRNLKKQIQELKQQLQQKNIATKPKLVKPKTPVKLPISKPKLKPKTPPKDIQKPTKKPNQNDPSKSPIVIDIDDNKGSSKSTWAQVKEWASLIGEIGGGITAIPVAAGVVMGTYYCLTGAIKCSELLKIAKSKDSVGAVIDALKKGGNITEAKNVESFSKSFIGKVETLSELVQNLKENSLDISPRNLRAIRNVLQNLHENPEQLAEKFNISIEQVDELKEALLQKANPLLEEVAEKLSKIDISKLEPEELINLKQISEEFKNISEVDPDVAPLYLDDINQKLEDFAQETDLPISESEPLPIGVPGE